MTDRLDEQLDPEAHEQARQRAARTGEQLARGISDATIRAECQHILLMNISLSSVGVKPGLRWIVRLKPDPRA